MVETDLLLLNFPELKSESPAAAAAPNDSDRLQSTEDQGEKPPEPVELQETPTEALAQKDSQEPMKRQTRRHATKANDASDYTVRFKGNTSKKWDGKEIIVDQEWMEELYDKAELFPGRTVELPWEGRGGKAVGWKVVIVKAPTPDLDLITAGEPEPIPSLPTAVEPMPSPVEPVVDSGELERPKSKKSKGKGKAPIGKQKKTAGKKSIGGSSKSSSTATGRIISIGKNSDDSTSDQQSGGQANPWDQKFTELLQQQNKILTILSQHLVGGQRYLPLPSDPPPSDPLSQRQQQSSFPQSSSSLPPPLPPSSLPLSPPSSLPLSTESSPSFSSFPLSPPSSSSLSPPSSLPSSRMSFSLPSFSQSSSQLQFSHPGKPLSLSDSQPRLGSVSPHSIQPLSRHSQLLPSHSSKMFQEKSPSGSRFIEKPQSHFAQFQEHTLASGKVLLTEQDEPIPSHQQTYESISNVGHQSSGDYDCNWTDEDSDYLTSEYLSDWCMTPPSTQWNNSSRDASRSGSVSEVASSSRTVSSSPPQLSSRNIPPVPFSTPPKLRTVEQVMNNNSGSDIASLRRLTTALAREAIFGRDELAKKSLTGRNDTEQLAKEKLNYIKTLVRSRVPHKSDVEFEMIWKLCRGSLSKSCQTLRTTAKKRFLD